MVVFRLRKARSAPRLLLYVEERRVRQGRHLGELGELRVHAVPRLGAGREDVHGRLVPVRVVQAARVDEDNQGPVGFLSQDRRAALGAEPRCKKYPLSAFEAWYLGSPLKSSNPSPGTIRIEAKALPLYRWQVGSDSCRTTSARLNIRSGSRRRHSRPRTKTRWSVRTSWLRHLPRGRPTTGSRFHTIRKYPELRKRASA